MHSARNHIAGAARAAAAALVVAAALALPASAAALEPIEGTWAYQGGRVLVEPTGPGTFKGTVTRPTRFLACDHPLGERMWSLSGGGATYTGTHQWFTEPECAPAPGGAARWTVRETAEALLLDFCTAPP
nr:hypothetical protein [Actinomycetota bacterium]